MNEFKFIVKVVFEIIVMLACIASFALYFFSDCLEEKVHFGFAFVTSMIYLCRNN